MNDVLVIIILLVVFILAIVYIPQFFIKRAIRAVLKIFRKNIALNKNSAKTIDELGLTPPSFLTKMMSTRDYKPKALELLINMEIIQSTEDGRFFLSEEKLAASNLKGR